MSAKVDIRQFIAALGKHRAAWVDGITDAGQAELLLPPDASFTVQQAITRRHNGKPYTYLTVRYNHARR